MTSSDSSSSTSSELQAIEYAISCAIGLGLKKLAVFSDSSAAISIASLAILAGPHQSKELNKIQNENQLFRRIFNTLHENGKKFNLLAIVHVKAHQQIVCHITETNSLCDVMAKQAAKAALLARIPSHIVKPKVTEVKLPIEISNDNILTY